MQLRSRLSLSARGRRGSADSRAQRCRRARRRATAARERTIRVPEQPARETGDCGLSTTRSGPSAMRRHCPDTRDAPARARRDSRRRAPACTPTARAVQGRPAERLLSIGMTQRFEGVPPDPVGECSTTSLESALCVVIWAFSTTYERWCCHRPERTVAYASVRECRYPGAPLRR